MPKMTDELRLKILQTTKIKVQAGHTLGTCFTDSKPGAANPTKGYCLRGALRDAIKENGFSDTWASEMSQKPSAFRIDIGGHYSLCSFSDEKGKSGCIKAVDKAIAKFSKLAA